MADVPVSASPTHVAQLEATIGSAHALLQAGLIDEATSLLAAFSPEVQPEIDEVCWMILLTLLSRKTHKFCKFEDEYGEPYEGSDSLSRKLRRAAS